MGREDPDVICLQEVRFNPYRKSKVHEFFGRYVSRSAPGPEMTPGKHMLEDLFQYLPQYRQHHVWEAGMHYDDHQVEGLAILSKFPIRSHAVKRLAKHAKGDGNSRICIGALIAHPWGDIQVFDTHFTYAVEGQSLQCKEVSRFLAQESRGAPQLLMGDFNCFRRSVLANAFLSGGSIDGESLPLVDTWTNLHSNDPGYTFPSYHPNERLDRILFSPGLQPTACYKVGEATEPDVWASDHCGLVATFRLP